MTKAITSSLLLKPAHSLSALRLSSLSKMFGSFDHDHLETLHCLGVCDCRLNVCQYTLLFKVLYSKSNTIISTSKEGKKEFSNPLETWEMCFRHSGFFWHSSKALIGAGVLSLYVILVQARCCRGGWGRCCGTLSCIPGLLPLNASNTPPLDSLLFFRPFLPSFPPLSFCRSGVPHANPDPGRRHK